MTSVGESVPVQMDHSLPPASEEPRPKPERRAAAFGVWGFVGRFGALGFLGLIMVVMTVLRPSTFATTDNMLNIVNQAAVPCVAALGLTFVLVAGEFDLSVGYLASLAGILGCTALADMGVPLPIAFAVAVAVGAAVGLLNGLIVTKVGVNALIATLGIGTIAVGANYAVSGGLAVIVPDTGALIAATSDRLFGVPRRVYFVSALVVLLWLVLNRTVLGQGLRAVGANPVAARLAGLNVDRIKIVAFVIGGSCAGLAGMLLASRSGSASATGGDSFLLSSFAAVFFGSAVLRDYEFHVVGTVVGVLTVVTGFNSIALLGIPTYWQYFLQGMLLVLGVGISTLARRYSGR